MLAYSRNKSIGVQKQSDDLIVVSGVLEDELYAMACEIAISRPGLVIERVQARMKRFTTSRCPLAEGIFIRAEGWKLDDKLDGRIKKELGREGCRHMAALMIDCCRAAARAELARKLRAALESDPELDKKAFTAEFFARRPHLEHYAKLR
ncbi:MAG: DUF2889 domain-containing protein [Desulfomonile sp.]|nr:DUF2889 domain-containing protein [Desulfomonile sp.]